MDNPSSELQWFAVRYRQPVNRGRTVVFRNQDIEIVEDRRGRKRRRPVKGSGTPEFVVELQLRDRGFETFLPVRKEWRRKSRYDKHKTLVDYPLLVGWVFVGWPKGENRWHDLFDIPMVGEVVSSGGRPLRIPQSKISELADRWGGDRTAAPDRERWMRTHEEFNVGDKVQVMDGPFDGHTVEVVDLRGPQATILALIFGEKRRVDIATDLLAVA